MLKERWKSAFIWSTVGTSLIAASEFYVRLSAGTKAGDALEQVLWWVVVWPAFFGAIWLITSWREISKRAQEMDAAREARRAVSGPVVPDGAACPRCGSFNPPVAIHCILCGLQLKNVEVVHWAELLPGARESLPSVL